MIISACFDEWNDWGTVRWFYASLGYHRSLLPSITLKSKLSLVLIYFGPLGINFNMVLLIIIISEILGFHNNNYIN
jgi:hypothetical protein